MAQAPEAPRAGTPTPAAVPPPTQVVIVDAGPTTLDGQFQNLAPQGQALQPTWPGTWPPYPALPSPTLPDPYSYAVPWRPWVQAMAVRPFVTDPPPCPRPVSRYRSTPITMT